MQGVYCTTDSLLLAPLLKTVENEITTCKVEYKARVEELEGVVSDCKARVEKLEDGASEAAKLILQSASNQQEKTENFLKQEIDQQKQEIEDKLEKRIRKHQ